MAEGGLADSLKEPSVRKTYPKGVNEFTYASVCTDGEGVGKV